MSTNSESSVPIVPYIRKADFAVRDPWHYGERRLLDYLLILVQRGTVYVVLEGKSLEINRGECCLIRPGELHTLRCGADTVMPFAHLDVFYNARRTESFVTRPGQTDLTAFVHLAQPNLETLLGLDPPPRFAPSQLARFRETMLRMIGLWLGQDARSRLEANHLAMTLVLLLLEDFGASRTAPPQPGSLRWVTPYLSLHLTQPVRVAALAERANLSVSRFSEVFRARFGQSPHQYLTHLRIERAQTLLRSTRLALGDIAEQCGFADSHHLSKTFKRWTGITPGAFRHDGSSLPRENSEMNTTLAPPPSTSPTTRASQSSR